MGSIVCFLSFYKFDLLLQEENRKYFFVSLLSNLEKMCNRFNTSAKDCKHYVMGCGGGTVLASVWIFLQVYTIRLSSEVLSDGNSVLDKFGNILKIFGMAILCFVVFLTIYCGFVSVLLYCCSSKRIRRI